MLNKIHLNRINFTNKKNNSTLLILLLKKNMMQSNRIYLCLFFTLIFISCKKNIVEPTPLPIDVVSSQTIDDLIYKSTISVGGFDWNSADEKIVWSAFKHSDNIMSIGFKPA